jgi:hypothetical protein
MESERRVGLNEAIFREVNERLEEVGESFGLDYLDLICECANIDCAERITVSVQEYEALRANPRLFAVVPGHETDDLEEIVERRDGYDVILKNEGQPARIAEETDPRAD